MIIESSDVYPTDFDALWRNISDSRVLDEGTTGAAKWYKEADLLTRIEHKGMWLPAEAVKVLQGEALSREEKLRLADFMLSQHPFGRYRDESLALSSLYLSPANQFLAEVWDKEIPEAEGHNFFDVNPQQWGLDDVVEWVGYFYGTGLPKIVGNRDFSLESAKVVAEKVDAYKKECEDAKLSSEDLSPTSNFCVPEQLSEFGMAPLNYALTEKYYQSQRQRLPVWNFLIDMKMAYGSNAILDKQGVVDRLDTLKRCVSRSPGESSRGNTWLAVRHLWRSVAYSGAQAIELGVSYVLTYLVVVLFGLGVLTYDVVVAGSASAIGLCVGLFVLPIVGFWLAMKWLPQWMAWLFIVVLFVAGITARIWLIGVSGSHGLDGSLLVLTILSGVLIGWYPVYWGGMYRRVLRNADKYGPFACVWFRPFVDKAIGKDGVEFVLTDSDGEIVWIRRMGQSAARKFTSQFVYEYPNSGVWDFFGAEEHWRQVFPALLCPREVTPDFKYTWHTWMVTGWAPMQSDYDLAYVTRMSDTSWLWRHTFGSGILWRPETLSEAHVLDVPGLSYESRDVYISEFGLDKHPRGYEQALQDGKLVKANAKY